MNLISNYVLHIIIFKKSLYQSVSPDSELPSQNTPVLNLYSNTIPTISKYVNIHQRLKFCPYYL